MARTSLYHSKLDICELNVNRIERKVMFLSYFKLSFLVQFHSSLLFCPGQLPLPWSPNEKLLSCFICWGSDLPDAKGLLKHWKDCYCSLYKLCINSPKTHILPAWTFTHTHTHMTDCPNPGWVPGHSWWPALQEVGFKTRTMAQIYSH